MAKNRCLVLSCGVSEYEGDFIDLLSAVIYPVLDDDFGIAATYVGSAAFGPEWSQMPDLVILVWAKPFEEGTPYPTPSLNPNIRWVVFCPDALFPLQSPGFPSGTPIIPYSTKDFGVVRPQFSSVVDKLFPNLQAQPLIRIPPAGATPSFGEFERAQREEVLQLLERLCQVMAGRIGHNRPPLTDDATAENISNGIGEATAIIRDELKKPEPNVQDVARAGTFLEGAKKWAADARDASAKSYGTEMGRAGAVGTVAAVGAAVAAATGYLPALRDLLTDLVHHIAAWLHAVVPGL